MTRMLSVPLVGKRNVRQQMKGMLHCRSKGKPCRCCCQMHASSSASRPLPLLEPLSSLTCPLLPLAWYILPPPFSPPPIYSLALPALSRAKGAPICRGGKIPQYISAALRNLKSHLMQRTCSTPSTCFVAVANLLCGYAESALWLCHVQLCR